MATDCVSSRPAATSSRADRPLSAARTTLLRHAPSATLAPYVSTYWILRWNVEAPVDHESPPTASVNVVLGHHRPGVWGPSTLRFAAPLTHTGFAIGATFHPGGFRPWLGRDVIELANATRSLSALFSAPPSIDASTDAALIATMEAMLLAHPPVADANIALTKRAFELARLDPHLVRSDDLATRLGMSPRTLERLFRRYVGVQPKWLVRRFRVLEACERAKTGDAPNWAQLATELGYLDVGHFVRDFKQQIGRTPADYAALCATR